jgi:hypothetical protein
MQLANTGIIVRNPNPVQEFGENAIFLYKLYKIFRTQIKIADQTLFIDSLKS